MVNSKTSREGETVFFTASLRLSWPCKRNWDFWRPCELAKMCLTDFSTRHMFWRTICHLLECIIWAKSPIIPQRGVGRLNEKNFLGKGINNSWNNAIRQTHAHTKNWSWVGHACVPTPGTQCMWLLQVLIGSLCYFHLLWLAFVILLWFWFYSTELKSTL